MRRQRLAELLSLLRRGGRAGDRPANPRRDAELRGERVVFRALEREGFLEPFRGLRILEVGPKHGLDSQLLGSLEPSELVLVDLPQKRELVDTWLPALEKRCPTHYVEANLLYMSPTDLGELGRFDLVWCTGVVYHNAEQLRLLRRLFRLCLADGALVLESSTTRDPRLADLNVVEIHWPEPYRDSRHITHHPSRRALASWLEMVGFAEVELRDVYSPGVASQRAVLTAVRPRFPQPHVLFASDEGPTWIAGEAAANDDAATVPVLRPRLPARTAPVAGSRGARDGRRPSRVRRSLRGMRQRSLTTALLALTGVFFFLVFLPEELGDRPYDVFGLRF